MKLHSRTATLAAGLAILSVSCAGQGAKDEATECLRNIGVSWGTHTVEEAQALLLFQPVLPSFIPEHTAPEPNLAVYCDEDGVPDQLQAIYWEADRESGREDGVRIRITESLARVATRDDAEIQEVNGTAVQLVSDLYRDSEALLFVMWNQGKVAVQAEFLWLVNEDAHGSVTDDMKAEAINVIESMIDQGGE